MTTISHILFDLGNVVISIAPDLVTEELSRLSKKTIAECDALLSSEGSLWRDMAVGRYSAVELTNWINAELNMRLSIDELERIMNRELVSTIESTASLLPILAEEAILGCLSNTNAIHWAELLRAFPIMNTFRHRFASQELSSAKPSQEIYQMVEDILGVKPENILFFDDKSENVEAAAQRGWHARQYVSYEGLVRDLRSSGFGV